MSSMHRDRASNLNFDLIGCNSPERGHIMSTSTLSQAYDVTYCSPSARSSYPLKRNNFHINKNELSPKSPQRIVFKANKTNEIHNFVETCVETIKMQKLNKQIQKTAKEKLREKTTTFLSVNQIINKPEKQIDDKAVQNSTASIPEDKKKENYVDLSSSDEFVYEYISSSDNGSFDEEIKQIVLTNPKLNNCQSPMPTINTEFSMNDSIDDELLSIDLDNISTINKSFGNKSGLSRYKSMPTNVSSSTSGSSSLKRKNNIVDTNLIGNKLYKSSNLTTMTGLNTSSSSSSTNDVHRPMKQIENPNLKKKEIKPAVSNISAVFAEADSSDDDLLSIDLDYLANDKSSIKNGFSRHKSMPVNVMTSSSLKEKKIKCNAVELPGTSTSIKSNNQPSSSSSSSSNSYTMTDEEKESVARKREKAMAKLRASRQRKVQR